MSDTAELVASLRRRGAETSTVEVKAAAGGTPRSLRETLSAFANGRGGTILLGLSEDLRFEPVDGFDASAVMDGVAGMASNDLTPPLRAVIEIERIDGSAIVRVDVAELDAIEKPCFVSAQGHYGGSYVRVGDGDRRLSEYEVSQLLANRSQPRYDLEPVPDAHLNDLDATAVTALLSRVRDRQPRVFGNLSDADTLQKLGVLCLDNGELVPTLGGLLGLGTFPQQFFPQLNVTFVALPGLHMGETSPTGQRFLDSQGCDGPLPVMIDDAVRAVIRNMTRSAIIRGVGREDRYEYPVEVVRELIVNAVMHRDYSPAARGTQVQIELYPDRLVVKSPGGIFGTIDASQFGAPNVTSSRNATLARLLSDLVIPRTNNAVCENRGSGIPSIMSALRSAGMTPPAFDAPITHVHVTVPHHALMDSETLVWLDGLHQAGLTEGQRMALAMMRNGREVSNETLRGWGLHRADATSALANLVQRGVVERTGGRRYATYRLVDEPTAQQATTSPGVAPGRPRSATRGKRALLEMLALISASGGTTSREIEEQLGLSYATTLRRINALVQEGFVSPTAAVTSRNRTYVATAAGRKALTAPDSVQWS